MLGGFKCSKNTLIGLNAFYIIIGIVLIAIGSHWSTSNMVSSLPIIGGVVACGIFLILISTVGIIGAARHHQVLLFFYMVILFIVFLIQFIVALACLSVSTETQKHLAHQGWSLVGDSVKNDVQINFECCGFESVANNETNPKDPMNHPPCFKIPACSVAVNQTEPNTCTGDDQCCSAKVDFCSCSKCDEKLNTVIDKAYQTTGGVSLFFSFTEIIGALLAWRFRNLYANSVSLP